VKDVSACTYRCRMSTIDVDDRQCDLRTRGRFLLRRKEGKMRIRPLLPGDFCVPSANPAVVDPIVAQMEIWAELTLCFRNGPWMKHSPYPRRAEPSHHVGEVGS
jgi:hypothetical protein